MYLIIASQIDAEDVADDDDEEGAPAPSGAKHEIDKDIFIKLYVYFFNFYGAVSPLLVRI